jgi:hypothetical protein
VLALIGTLCLIRTRVEVRIESSMYGLDGEDGNKQQL